ncbi:MAG: hypothetical protein CHACPFDD_01641 [Phycisphaerae bacterium]|nr:hypothetical protein [Phycisphaerae bacterium]
MPNPRNPRLPRIVAAAVAIVAATVAGAQESRPAAPLDPEVDKILSRLEDADIRDVRARLEWSIRYTIEDTVDTKLGEIWYKQLQPVARFKVRFEAVIRDERRTKLDETHMFDGRWYVELRSDTRTVTRRELRRPDEIGNPYRLGEGLFPVPFGQKKADILSEFDVALAPPVDADPPHSDHLLLTPRPGTRTAERYSRIEFWVDRNRRGLPVRVRAVRNDGHERPNEILTISFTDIDVNAGFAASIFEIEKPAGYREEVEPLPPPDVLVPPTSAPSTP